MELSNHRNSVLFLGVGGKVGRLLARFWAENPPHEIRPVFQTSGAIWPGFLHWRQGDPVSDLPKVDAVVALWGVTPGGRQPMNANVTLALEALKIAEQTGARRVFLASSSAVYSGAVGAAARGRHAEGDILAAPHGAYGLAKLEMERAVLDRPCAPDALRVTILRMANVIGADSLFTNLTSGGAITLDRFASGFGPMRSYLAVDDLARVIEVLVTCAADALPDVLNLSGSTALAMADLVSHAGGNVVWRPAPENAIEKVELDTGALEKLTGPLVHSSDAALAIASWKCLQKRKEARR